MRSRMPNALLVLGIAVSVVFGGASTAYARPQGVEILCERTDYGCVAGHEYSGQSTWGSEYANGHNCVSYVAYRLQRNGAARPWPGRIGNAKEWDDFARGRFPVDGNPEVGSVAQWNERTGYAPGEYGHIAYVEVVTPSYIEVTEDNWSTRPERRVTRRVRIQRSSGGWPSNFIHIHDTPPPPPQEAPPPPQQRDGMGCPSEGCFIRSRASGKHISAELGYSGDRRDMLRARADRVDLWERFGFIGDCRQHPGCAIFSKANGRFVSAELGYGGSLQGMLRARATGVAGWERFIISGDCAGPNGCTIRSSANNRFVSAELGYRGADYGMLRARAPRASSWESFAIEGAAPPPPPPPPAPAPAPADRLNPDQQLRPGEFIRSGDGRFIFALQGDSNIVLYQGNRALWASNTVGRGIVRLVMQGDGNLVGYDSANRAQWHSRTHGRPGALLVMQNDGNAVLYQGNRPVWATNTCCR